MRHRGGELQVMLGAAGGPPCPLGDATCAISLPCKNEENNSSDELSHTRHRALFSQCNGVVLAFLRSLSS